MYRWRCYIEIHRKEECVISKHKESADAGTVQPLQPVRSAGMT